MIRNWLPLGLLLFLALVLTLWLRDTVADMLVPLYYLYWIGRRLLETIPQVVIWALFLFVVLLLAAGSLFSSRPAKLSRRRRAPAREDRIAGWVKLLHQADRETYYKWQLAQRLQELTLDLVSHDERLPHKQVRQQLMSSHLDLPPEVEAYLQASLISFSNFIGAESRYSSRQGSPLDLDPEQVVRFLEEKFDYRIE